KEKNRSSAYIKQLTCPHLVHLNLPSIRLLDPVPRASHRIPSSKPCALLFSSRAVYCLSKQLFMPGSESEPSGTRDPFSTSTTVRDSFLAMHAL
ncbi:hypothetical protein PENTCL1PPCAC_9737, partial [Pristionchus entomophagus]